MRQPIRHAQSRRHSHEQYGQTQQPRHRVSPHVDQFLDNNTKAAPWKRGEAGKRPFPTRLIREAYKQYSIFIGAAERRAIPVKHRVLQSCLRPVQQ